MKRESDLYEPVKRFLEKKRYEVYAEVKMPHRTSRIDVLGYQSEDDMVAVEMKTSLSSELVGQAINRKLYFPKVYVAIPERKKKIPEQVLERLAFYGIGILEVYDLGSEQKVRVRQQAFYFEPRYTFRKPWSEILKPEMKEWVPGGHAGGGYVTEYALTMKRIREYLALARRIDELKQRDNPESYETDGWRTAAEIVDHCKTHWANPKKQIISCLLEIEGEWIEAKKEKNRWWFRLRNVPRETI